MAKQTSNGYILIATDYCTNWVEAVALRDNKDFKVAKFLNKNIKARLGCFYELVSDQGGHFLGEITGRKIFQAGLWWPSVLKDAHDFAK